MMKTLTAGCRDLKVNWRACGYFTPAWLLASIILEPYFGRLEARYIILCLIIQCFDAVGWAAGRASGL